VRVRDAISHGQRARQAQRLVLVRGHRARARDARAFARVRSRARVGSRVVVMPLEDAK
jgi:hypothetical protein